MTSAVSSHHPSAPAADFGDVRGEFRALLSSCGIYDLSSRAKVEVTGSDRVRWLNGMVTNNVRDLASGHGVYAFLLNPQGHILGDLYAYNRGDTLLLDIDQSQLEKTLAHFGHYIIMDDVEVAHVSDKVAAIGIGGPRTPDILKAAGLEVSELAPLQFADTVWREIALTVVRGDNEKLPTFELWLNPSALASVWDALVKAGAQPVGNSALELLRIALGIPRYGQDIRERDLPQETEQVRALNFSKGCYIGQEIVERIRSRGSVHRTFAGFRVQGGLPAAGTKIQAEGKDAGEITSVVSLPLSSGEFPFALGYIRREAAVPGKQLAADGTKIVVTSLPFAEAFKH